VANPKRSDAAYLEDCDWSFVDRPEVMKGLDKVARLAGDWYGFDYDDVRQDLCLWLGVRPEVQAKPDYLIVLDLRMEMRAMYRKAQARGGLVDFTSLEGVE
jgi:hypothetical protein